MTAPLLIPLSGISETFRIALAGTAYRLTVIWRDDPGGMGGWFLDIADDNSVPIVEGIPLVTGADLLEQHAADSGIAGSLYVQTVQNPLAMPTFDNLGGDAQLFFVPAG
jgi:hypothetical protein